ncbi:hypothetical protein GYMLUDRAFT_112876, partial [Collybiopsis luxurians FD-317 M1]
VHGFGSVEHIEGIAVDKNQPEKKFGSRIIQDLTDVQRENGGYKTILNCSNENTHMFNK